MRYFHTSSKSYSVIRTKNGKLPGKVQARFLAEVFAWIFEDDIASAHSHVIRVIGHEAYTLEHRNRVLAAQQSKIDLITHQLSGWRVSGGSATQTPSEERMILDFIEWYAASDEEDASARDRELASQPLFIVINLNAGRSHAFVRR